MRGNTQGMYHGGRLKLRDVVFLCAERFQTILVGRFIFYKMYSPNISLSLSAVKNTQRPIVRAS